MINFSLTFFSLLNLSSLYLFILRDLHAYEIHLLLNFIFIVILPLLFLCYVSFISLILNINDLLLILFILIAFISFLPMPILIYDIFIVFAFIFTSIVVSHHSLFRLLLFFISIVFRFVINFYVLL
jgi:hypothetical protein